MNLAIVLTVALPVAFVIWLVDRYVSRAYGKTIGGLLALPLLIPIIRVVVGGFAAIQTAEPAAASQVAEDTTETLLAFLRNDLPSLALGDVAGVALGAVASRLTGK